MDVKKLIVEFVKTDGECKVGKEVINKHLPRNKIFDFVTANDIDWIPHNDGSVTFFVDKA